MTTTQGEIQSPEALLSKQEIEALMPLPTKEKSLQEKLSEEILLVGVYGPQQIELSVSTPRKKLLENTDKHELSNAIAILLGFEKPYNEAGASALETKYQYDLPQLLGEHLAFSIRLEGGRAIVDRGDYYSRALQRLDATERSRLFYDVLDELGCPTP